MKNQILRGSLLPGLLSLFVAVATLVHSADNSGTGFGCF